MCSLWKPHTTGSLLSEKGLLCTKYSCTGFLWIGSCLLRTSVGVLFPDSPCHVVIWRGRKLPGHLWLFSPSLYLWRLFFPLPVLLFICRGSFPLSLEQAGQLARYMVVTSWLRSRVLYIKSCARVSGFQSLHPYPRADTRQRKVPKAEVPPSLALTLPEPCWLISVVVRIIIIDNRAV